MKKQIISVFLTASMFLSTTAFASELPKSFWGINTKYANALDNSDYNGIITYGTQTVELLRNEEKTEQVCNIMASRLEQIGLAYERYGDYTASAQAYSEYLGYAEKMGWYDGVKIGRAKLLQFTPELRLYTPTQQTQVYFGAKNEPEKGVIYGKVYNDYDTEPLKQESLTHIYLSFGDNYLSWVEPILAQAEENGCAVEIAWNFPNEGNDMGNVASQGEHIYNVINIIKNHPNLPIYLRIGAEMNIWSVMPEPSAFIRDFQLLANTAHAECPNVAVVWSVAHASGWNTEMNDYYPGDEYVDWVGISAYANKHFQGRLWDFENSFNETVFSAGNSADPIKLIDEVIQKYGYKKPIMLSECGVSHTVRTLGVNSTDWAKTKLRQMYQYVPMVYPQVKLISYFNVEIPNETNDYALKTNSDLYNTYNETTAVTPNLIKSSYTAAPEYIHRELTDGFTAEGSSLPVSVYAHTYGVDEPVVNYYIDGVWNNGSSTLPYTKTLDISALPDGMHTLYITAESGGQVLTDRTFGFNKITPIRIYVNNILTESDVSPVIENDRTLVPVRVISENLNAQVDWDDSAKAVIITKNNSTVKLVIGDVNIYSDTNEVIAVTDVAARIIDGRTMVPIRAVADIFGADVQWDANTRSVYINE